MSVCEKTAGIANKRRLEELEGRQGRVGPIEGQECQATAFPQVRVAKRKTQETCTQISTTKKADVSFQFARGQHGGRIVLTI